MGLLGGYFGRVQLLFIGLFLFLVFPARLLPGHAFLSRALRTVFATRNSISILPVESAEA